MSVRLRQRKQNLLQVIQVAQLLYIYSVKTCNNEKYFKKRYYRQTSAYIIQYARTILNNCVLANQLDLYNNYQLRANYQSNALLTAQILKTHIITCNYGFGLNTTKAKSWQQLIQNWQNLCKKWIKSDKERFEQATKNVVK